MIRAKEVYCLTENGDISCVATYSKSMTAKQALRNYIMQFLKHEMNTWDYPEEVKGMWKAASDFCDRERWYFTDTNNGNTYSCYD